MLPERARSECARSTAAVGPTRVCELEGRRREYTGALLARRTEKGMETDDLLCSHNARTGNRQVPYFFLNPFIQKLREWPRLLFTARIERYTCSLQARLFSLWGWGLIDLPLRASNEGSPRPRVARAQKIISLHPLLCSASKKGTWPLPIPSSAELIPRIALFDRPEHRFFEFLQRHVLRIADGC